MDANVRTDVEAGIFQDAYEALVFALKFEWPHPTLARILQSGPLGRAHGLVGYTGAGQAGMILAQLGRLPDPQILALVARSTNHHARCECGRPCCSGWHPDPVWTNAITELGETLHAELAGQVMYRQVRQAIIERFFGYKKVTIKAIAEKCAIPERTMNEHVACVNRALKDLEGRGWHAFSDALMTAGFLIVSD